MVVGVNPALYISRQTGQHYQSTFIHSTRRSKLVSLREGTQTVSPREEKALYPDPLEEKPPQDLPRPVTVPAWRILGGETPWRAPQGPVPPANPL